MRSWMLSRTLCSRMARREGKLPARIGKTFHDASRQEAENRPGRIIQNEGFHAVVE
jgi:hypothetical protein